MRLSSRQTTILLLVFLTALPAFAQTRSKPTPEDPAVEKELPIIDTINQRCWSREDVGPVVSEETFRKLITSGANAATGSTRSNCLGLQRLKVDFTKHSVLTYRVRGDCFVRGTARVTRNDELKKYTLRITKIYGGCRAAGSVEGWIVVEKLRPDYEIESVTMVRDESGVRRDQ